MLHSPPQMQRSRPHCLAGRPSCIEPPQRADCICWSRCRLPGAASCRATPSDPHVALSGDLGGGGLCFMKTLNMICARAAARPVSDKYESQPDLPAGRAQHQCAGYSRAVSHTVFCLSPARCCGPSRRRRPRRRWSAPLQPVCHAADPAARCLTAPWRCRPAHTLTQGQQARGDLRGPPACDQHTQAVVTCTTSRLLDSSAACQLIQHTRCRAR